MHSLWISMSPGLSVRSTCYFGHSVLAFSLLHGTKPFCVSTAHPHMLGRCVPGLDHSAILVPFVEFNGLVNRLIQGEFFWPSHQTCCVSLWGKFPIRGWRPGWENPAHETAPVGRRYPVSKWIQAFLSMLCWRWKAVVSTSLCSGESLCENPVAMWLMVTDFAMCSPRTSVMLVTLLQSGSWLQKTRSKSVTFDFHIERRWSGPTALPWNCWATVCAHDSSKSSLKSPPQSHGRLPAAQPWWRKSSWAACAAESASPGLGGT